MRTFPMPLGADEEKHYLERVKEGDIEARNILIERNLRLVAHIVKKYSFMEEDIEDMISIGTIGLIKAVSTFDNTKGNRLATYAARCIDNELLMLLRTKKKTAKDVSLYEPIGTSKEGDEINLLDVVEVNSVSIYDEVDLKQDIEILYKVIESCLKPREKIVIELRYGLYNNKEYTQHEIAKYLGISRSYVSRIEKNALNQIKKAFEKYNYML
ncbi:RNA polymerase sporulation sigma factor SigK [Candidatus Galacturonibacter soehngenii]|uniref:RNA polymerase sigma factor n=1 Tax=Candidatus Galacturonatibacter soehngenii TaxID=2307010 RepID=A0A7V7UB91_9FIRM|nr:RNA polymerase sporulation sigma factor SigK [Candidatus Galacturonibacter soehngenii]KAB1437720.1 sigma-70 family RNA polymerase sigma factor [Candidatus Galacturonibacter soehngenii]